MAKMVKDALVTMLVVGSFVVGAVTLVREVVRPWPVPQVCAALGGPAPAAEPEYADGRSETAAVTYTITGYAK